MKMQISEQFKNAIDRDEKSIVVCDLNHEILYMNPTAREWYSEFGGEELIGQSFLRCHEKTRAQLDAVIESFKSGKHSLDFAFGDEQNHRHTYLTALRDENGLVCGYYEKREFKTEPEQIASETDVDMEDTLYRLEVSFFELRYISDGYWLERTLHENFCECGKSGRVYDKKETIDAMLSYDWDRDILLDDNYFKCEQAADNCWLVHYITIEDGKRFYRTSVWVTEDAPKLFFHQATPLKQ